MTPQPLAPPLPYPTGWAAVAFSDELSIGDVVPTRAFGTDLVLFRSEDGQPGILDAYCPHMGAHLGHGGRVEANDIVCPFHGWRWSREGACVGEPSSQPHSTSVRTPAWPARDRNGFIYVWYTPSGEPPSWEVEEIPETVDRRFRITDRKLWPDVQSHPQELNENGVDLAHFTTVHEFETRGIDWKPDGHIYSLQYDIDDLDTGLGDNSKYQLESFTEGPCCTRTRFSGGLEGVTLHSWIPTDPGVLTVRSLYLFKDDVSDEAAHRVFENSQFGWERDINIWHHKQYKEKPLLRPDETIVLDFRRWFQQFYVV
jgi:phenylpropionate dioxygenase-like ring-hydroxylating dioxygenase large terminal subunit